MTGFFGRLFFFTLVVNLLASNETNLDDNNNLKTGDEDKFKTLEITDVDAEVTITIIVESDYLPEELSFYDKETDTLNPNEYPELSANKTFNSHEHKQPADDRCDSEEYFLASEKFSDNPCDSEEYFLASEKFSDDFENSNNFYDYYYNPRDSDDEAITYDNAKKKGKTKDKKTKAREKKII